MYKPVFCLLQERSIERNRYTKFLTDSMIRPMNNNFWAAQNSVFATAGNSTC